VIGSFGQIADAIAGECANAVRLGGVPLGQVDTLIANAIANYFSQHGDELAASMSEYVAPLTQKAMDVIKPSVYEALRDYTPTFAAVSGGMLALAVFLGIWIARRGR